MISQRRPAIRESQGTGTLLVLLDSSQPESLHLPETLFSALSHFGMPYRVCDVSRGPVRAEDLLRNRAVVIAQENLGMSLSADAVAAVLRAVQAGLGLVNLDHDLGAYGPAYREALGIASAKPAIRATQAVTTAHGAHYVTWTREVGARIALRRPVPVHAGTVSGPGDRVLLACEDGTPALCTGTVGTGRVVQWLVSPKLWLPEVLGHARGLDDLFWKGIVWAARKPFVMKAMPPYVRARLDDCDGHWRDARDLDFVDVLNECGHLPNLGLCMRAVTADGARRVKTLFDEGKADFSPHTLAPGLSLFYGDEGGEYTGQQLAELMAEMDGLLAGWGIKPSRVLSDHNHMWSARAIPFLLERGITFKMNITLPGEQHEGIHVDWHPAPYGSMDYALDAIPGHPEFFVVFNHYPTFEAVRSYLPDGRFLWNRGGGFGEAKWDFLNGLTKSTLGQNDVATMARRYADHMRLSLDSLFFGGVITHSHFIKDLSLAEWRDLLKRAEALIPRHAKIYAHYDQIAEYARSKVETHLSRVDVSGEGGEVAVTVVGRATVPLQLYVFRDVDGGVEHRFETIGDCDGVRHATFPA